jgi:hypothetical protein
MQSAPSAGEEHQLSGADPFGKENMSADRKDMTLRQIIENDAESCVEEAVRFIYYTSQANRRNVRIMPNYQVAEVWDGRDWWTKSIRETMDEMIDRAVEEIEFHLDYCDLIPQEAKDDAENAIHECRTNPGRREQIRARVLETMISPFEDDD